MTDIESPDWQPPDHWDEELVAASPTHTAILALPFAIAVLPIIFGLVIALGITHPITLATGIGAAVVTGSMIRTAYEPTVESEVVYSDPADPEAPVVVETFLAPPRATTHRAARRGEPLPDSEIQRRYEPRDWGPVVPRWRDVLTRRNDHPES